MNTWLDGYKFGPLRWKFSPEWWEKERAKGKARFVAHGALTMSLAYVGLTALLKGIFGGPFSISLITFFLWGLIGGVPITISAWSENEKKYREALREAGLKALPNRKS
jgi:hypothetical protein